MAARSPKGKQPARQQRPAAAPTAAAEPDRHGAGPSNLPSIRTRRRPQWWLGFSGDSSDESDEAPAAAARNPRAAGPSKPPARRGRNAPPPLVDGGSGDESDEAPAAAQPDRRHDAPHQRRGGRDADSESGSESGSDRGGGLGGDSGDIMSSDVDDSSDIDDSDADETAKSAPGLLGLFGGIVAAASLCRPITDAAAHASPHLAAHRIKGFTSKRKVRYGNPDYLHSMQDCIIKEIESKRRQRYAAAPVFAIGADTTSIEYRTLREFLGVVGYRVTLGFRRVTDFLGFKEIYSTRGGDLCQAIATIVKEATGLRNADIRAKVCAFVTDGGANFAGASNGAVALFKQQHAPDCTPARCASHVLERATKKNFADVLETPGRNLQYHPAYYAWRALKMIVKDVGPYYRAIDARVNELFKEETAAAAAAAGAAAATGIPREPAAPVRRRPRRPAKPGDTRWTSYCRSIDKALQMLCILLPIIPEDVAVGSEIRRLDAVLGIAALAPFVRAMKRFVDAAQHNAYDLVSLRARGRRMLAHLRAIYTADFVQANDFVEWKRMATLGDYEDDGGDEWFVAYEIDNPLVPAQVVAMRCGKDEFVPMWTGWDTRYTSGGSLRQQDFMDAAIFDRVVEKVQGRVRAFVVGGARELGGDASRGVLGAIERSLAEKMTGFSGDMDTVLRGLDYETYIPNAQGAPDLGDVAHAAARVFPGLVDEDELRDQRDEFAEAAAAAAATIPARDNATHTKPLAGQHVGKRNRDFWTAVADGDDSGDVSEWIKLIKRVVAIPVSTAEGERHFSAVKLVLTRLRQELNDERLRQILTIKYARNVDVKRALHRWTKVKTRNHLY